jgi:hypothetical protein
MKTMLSTDGKITKIIAAELENFVGQKTEIIISKDEDKTIYINITNY